LAVTDIGWNNVPGSPFFGAIADMSVAGSHIRGSVAKCFLNQADVFSAPIEIRPAAVAESMAGMPRIFHSGTFQGPVHNLVHT